MKFLPKYIFSCSKCSFIYLYYAIFFSFFTNQFNDTMVFKSENLNKGQIFLFKCLLQIKRYVSQNDRAVIKWTQLSRQIALLSFPENTNFLGI